MQPIYFVLWFRLDGEDRYLIWYSGKRDGVVLDSNREVASFLDQPRLNNFAQQRDLAIQPEEPVLHDLDAITGWLGQHDNNAVDCDLVLTAWNLLIDVQSTVENRDVLRETPEHDALYQKLFWGNNFPSLTPPGKHFVPAWSGTEIQQLRGILMDGFRLFRGWVKETEPVRD